MLSLLHDITTTTTNMTNIYIYMYTYKGFPGGSFAHSVGLESSFHHKLIHNTSSALNLFVSLTLEQAASFQLPLILASHEAYLLKDQINHVKNECISLDSLIHIDSLCHSSLTNEVARRSSITQGN